MKKIWVYILVIGALLAMILFGIFYQKNNRVEAPPEESQSDVQTSTEVSEESQSDVQTGMAEDTQSQVGEQEFSWFAVYNGEKLQRIPGTEGDTYSPAICPDIVFYEAKEGESLEEIMHKMIDAMILPLTEPSENRAFTITEYRLEEQEYYLYDENIQDVWLLPCINGYYSYTGTDLVTMETVMEYESDSVKDGLVPFMRQGSEETFAFILMKEGNIYRLQRMQDMEILYSQNN